LAQFQQGVLDEMEQIRASALDGNRGPILQGMLATGRSLFARLGPNLPLDEFLRELPALRMPPVILSDLTVSFPVGQSTGTAQAVENWINKTLQLQDRFEEFVAACGL
jgi:hypothetical protein